MNEPTSTTGRLGRLEAIDSDLPRLLVLALAIAVGAVAYLVFDEPRAAIGLYLLIAVGHTVYLEAKEPAEARPRDPTRSAAIFALLAFLTFAALLAYLLVSGAR